MNIYSVHIVTSANEAFLYRPLLSLFTQRVSNSVHIVGWNGFDCFIEASLFFLKPSLPGQDINKVYLISAFSLILMAFTEAVSIRKKCY